MSAKSRSTSHRGNTVIEVLLAMSMAAILVVSISNLIVSVNRLDRTAADKDQALAYAQASLESLTAGSINLFSCQPAGTCGSCPARPGYTTCWNSCPSSFPLCTPNPPNATVYQWEPSGGTWQLTQYDQNNPIHVGSAPVFTRTMTMGNIGGDQNVKLITVTVQWSDRGLPKSVVQSTVLTAWKP